MDSTGSPSASVADSNAARPTRKERESSHPTADTRWLAPLRGWDGGDLLISGLGVLLLGAHLVYVATHGYYLRLSAGLYAVSLAIALTLSASLVYGGYWVKESELTAEMGWRVGTWSLAGVLGTVSMTFWPMLYQRLVGVTVEDPLFVLLVSAGLGANAGLLIGVYDLQSQRRLRQVEEARDGFQFLNRLLRHNVLNAINVIHGYATILEEGGADRRADDYGRKIRTHSEQVTELVDNAKVLVERVHGERSLRPVDLAAVVADEVATVRTLHPDATVETDLEADVRVRATELLSAVVENLVTNAIQHHDRQPASVAVSVSARDGTGVLRVADDGPGIPDGVRAGAFDPGEHGDNGLGLYLARTLVEDYGGEVRLADNEPRGTVVTVELPLA